MTRAAGVAAALLPMDGFHLDNDTLDARALRAVKGAPETFEAHGFAALLGGAAGAGPICAIRCSTGRMTARRRRGLLAADTPLVVVEGNYLLLPRGAGPGWTPCLI